MSWNFQMQLVNQSFDRISAWYKEYMNRTEKCFKAHNHRIKQLEERLAQQEASAAPSDEQLERVLRKILTEAFSEGGIQPPPTITPDPEWFVKNPKDMKWPRPVKVDPATLVMPPDAIPSKKWLDTFRKLEGDVQHFPDVPNNAYDDDDDDDYSDGDDVKMTVSDEKKPTFSRSV